MFPDRYFAKRHYPNRYFPPAGAAVPGPVAQQERRPTYGSKGEYPGGLEDERERFLKRQQQIALALLLDEF